MIGGWEDLLFLAVVGLGGLALVEWLTRSSLAGAAAVVVLVMLNPLDVGLFFDLGGFLVVYTDALALAFLAAATARFLRSPGLTGVQWLLIAYLALGILSVVRGGAGGDLAGALNEFRTPLRYLPIALYFSTVEPRRDLLDTIGKIWLVGSVGLVALALVRWVALVAGVSGGPLGVFGPGFSMRVYGSFATLALLQGFFVALAPWWIPDELTSRPERRIGLWAPVALATVVLLQHRTIWIAAVVGIFLLMARRPDVSRRLAGLVGVAAVVLIVLSVTIFDTSEVQVADSLAEQAGTTNTFEWRVEGWAVLLEDHPGPVSEPFLIGEPYGSGWDREVEGQVVTVSPHSFYLESYLRVGALGAALWLALHAAILYGLVTRAGPGGLMDNHILVALITTQLVYFLTSHPSPDQGLITGIAAATASAPHRSPAEPPPKAAPMSIGLSQ